MGSMGGVVCWGGGQQTLKWAGLLAWGRRERKGCGCMSDSGLWERMSEKEKRKNNWREASLSL